MKYFVTADIHGFFDEWMLALNNEGFDLNNKEHKIIICGDLFDRGNKPKEIIDFILENTDKCILIRGNHEDLMQSMILRNDNNVADIMNGTADTIRDLYPEWKNTEYNLAKIAEKTRLQEILDICIDYYETDHYIFVHGWIPINFDDFVYDSSWRKAGIELWQKARWCNPVEMFRHKIFEPHKTIVCGHFQCSSFWQEVNPELYSDFGPNANFEPFITDNVIALDACTAYTKKVNVVVLED